MTRVARLRGFFLVRGSVKGLSRRCSEQPPGIGIAHVLNATLNAGVELAKADPAFAVLGPALAEAARALS